MENPIKMDDLRIPPFQDTSIRAHLPGLVTKRLRFAINWTGMVTTQLTRTGAGALIEGTGFNDVIDLS